MHCAGLSGAILLTTPQGQALLVNADGLTFVGILKAPKQWADVAGDVQRSGADRFDMASWRTL